MFYDIYFLLNDLTPVAVEVDVEMTELSGQGTLGVVRVEKPFHNNGLRIKKSFKIK